MTGQALQIHFAAIQVIRTEWHFLVSANNHFVANQWSSSHVSLPYSWSIWLLVPGDQPLTAIDSRAARYNRFQSKTNRRVNLGCSILGLASVWPWTRRRKIPDCKRLGVFLSQPAMSFAPSRPGSSIGKVQRRRGKQQQSNNHRQDSRCFARKPTKRREKNIIWHRFDHWWKKQEFVYIHSKYSILIQVHQIFKTYNSFY